MHLWMIAIMIICASSLQGMLWRFLQRQSASWSQRWQNALTAFLAPPLLLVMTAAAMIQMGTEGVMLGVPVGKIGFAMGIGSVGLAGLVLGYLGIQAWRSLRRIQRLPSLDMCEQVSGAKLLDSSAPFAAQVGFWQPSLVVSRGLFTALTPDQVNAVLTHEAAHATYRDTFWFFWLGWVRVLTCWLPLTPQLWQELLLLREMRADREAAQTVDPLLLAEALLEIVRCPVQEPLSNCAAFNPPSSVHRLEERINALLSQEENVRSSGIGWVTLCVALMPLLAIALHHSS